jgi:3-hydroxyisobutyrate dehydrogenase-like beta-hydroxyacid dehydrogenase
MRSSPPNRTIVRVGSVVAAKTVGLLHPGEMGAAVGAVLAGHGARVVWASEGRSTDTRERAEAAGLEDVGSATKLAKSDVILSICPPHAVIEVARAVGQFHGVYVDANAVAPATARKVAEIVRAAGGEFVDGGIVGSPPREAGTTRLYLSGPRAETVRELFAGSVLDARVVSGASAVKMAYAAWTKGTTAMLLAIRDLARKEGVEEALIEEWDLSLPELLDRYRRAARSAEAKGWRWVGEMEEIAATFEAAGLPGGFHRAAAEVYRDR